MAKVELKQPIVAEIAELLDGAAAAVVVIAAIVGVVLKKKSK